MMKRYPITFEIQERKPMWGRELWLVSAHPSQPSVVANGPYAGRTLPELAATFGAELMGATAAGRGGFPLLVKIIESRDRLSLQVHPNEETAKLSGGDPKMEMWYVLGAEPGATLFAGLREGVERETLLRSLQEGTAEATVAQYKARRGDVLFIPGGLVHAVGGGCRLYEVQQTSDTTWRLHDWNRIDDKTGLPRPIHVREGLAAIDWSLTPPTLLRAGSTGADALISCAPFRFFVREFSSEIVLPARVDGFRLLFAEEGSCVVRMEEEDPVPLVGDVCALIPAGGACTVAPTGTCRLLIAEG